MTPFKALIIIISDASVSEAILFYGREISLMFSELCLKWLVGAKRCIMF